MTNNDRNAAGQESVTPQTTDRSVHPTGGGGSQGSTQPTGSGNSKTDSGGSK